MDSRVPICSRTDSSDAVFLDIKTIPPGAKPAWLEETCTSFFVWFVNTMLILLDVSRLREVIGQSVNRTHQPKHRSATYAFRRVSLFIPARKMEHMKLELRNSPSEVVRQGLRNYAGFGAPLSREGYAEREHRLNLLPFGKSGLRWVLIDTRNDGWTATCETFHRAAIYTEEQADGTVLVKQGTAAVVASVFTPEHLRGRGYAAEMMKQLREKLKEFDDVVLTTLYSDIGPSFYVRLGWPKVESKEAVIMFSKDRTIDMSSLKTDDSIQVIPLIEEELFATYLPADVELLPGDLLNEYEKRKKDGPVRTFALVPLKDQIEWLWERSKFYRQILGREKDGVSMTFAYAVGKPGKDASWSFFILYPNFKEDGLNVQRIRLSLKDAASHARALLVATVEEAMKLGLGKVSAWDTAPEVDAAFQALAPLLGDLKIGEREPDDSLSSVCWYGTDRKGDAKQMVWVANEKFCWA